MQRGIDLPCKSKRLMHTFQGISEQLAAERLKKDGPNSLTPPKSTHTIFKLIRSVFGGFNLLLWAAAVASLAGYIMELSSIGKNSSMDNLFLFIVLAGVVAGTGLFDFYQERKSGNIMKSFANMIPPKAHVSGTNLRRGFTSECLDDLRIFLPLIHIFSGSKLLGKRKRCKGLQILGGS